MTRQPIDRSHVRRRFADMLLIVLTVALLLSLVVAFSAVSIGIARADTLMPFGGGGSGRFALAVLIGLVITGAGGITAALIHSDKLPPERD
jgi:uncharacterized BrkB/YihY/UPF0761 family membrane protein